MESMASSHAAGADLSHFDSELLARLLSRNPLREAAAATTILSHCRGGSGNDYFTENVTLSSISSNNANPIARGVTGGGGGCDGASGSPTANKDEMAESYQWKKYGHKFLSSQNAKRFYYHCAERDTTGCPAKLIIDKVPKKKSKHGRRPELKDLVAAREVPGSAARRPPVDGAVVGADRESGSPRPAVAGLGEKGEDLDDSDFGWEENREILDALPVLERRVDRTLTPRRFWCRNRHNHLPPPQQPLHMIVSAAAVAQPRIHIAAARAGVATNASAAATVLPPPPAGTMTIPPAATLTAPKVVRTASSTSGAENAGGGGGSGGGTPRGPLTPTLADWPLPPKSRSPPVGPSSPEPATAGLERGSPPCGFPPRGLRPSGSPPCAHAGRKRARSPVARGAAADDHHKTRTNDAAATGWDRGSAMMTWRRLCGTAGSDHDVLAVKRGDSAMHPQPPPTAAPGPSPFLYSFPPLGALNARSTRKAPLLSALLDTLRPTAAAAASAAAATNVGAAAGAEARDSSAAAGVRQSAGGYDGGLLGGIACARSPAAEVSLTAQLVFPRGSVRVSSARGDSADAAAPASADASAVRAAAEGLNATDGGVACGKAEEGFETLWSYVEANLQHRVASQAAAAAAAAASAAAPFAVASQAADTAAGLHGLGMNGRKSVQHRPVVARLPRGILGLGEAQQEEAPQRAEGAAQAVTDIVFHAGTSCPVLPPLSSSIPAASAASADGGAGTGTAGRMFEEIQALYLQGRLSGQGLVGSGGEGLEGMERRLTEKKGNVFAGPGVEGMEGRRVCVDEGSVGLREAGGGGRGGRGGMVVARVSVEMDLIGQLGEETALVRQAGGHGAPQVLSTELCL